jgi:PAS domain S-box-containing protein
MHHPFEALIDIHQLQNWFDDFNVATGIATAIINRDGRILVSAGRQKICVDFHRRKPASKQLCVDNQARLKAALRDGEKAAINPCPHGLMHTVVPILVDNRHVANLFTGQFLLEDPDAAGMAEFKQRAATFGFDEAAYLAALADVPVIAKERVSHILRFLKRFAEMIGELGLRQLQLMEGEQTLARAQKGLQEATRHQTEKARWLAQILEANPIPTFVIDAQCRITHWNRACDLLTDIPASEIIGTDKHREAFYLQKRPLLADLMVRKACGDEIALLDDNTYRCSHWIDDGYEGEDFFPELGKYGKWLFFTASPLRDADGNFLGAIETLQDITARRLAEQEMCASEARYRQLFESANDAILIIKNGIIVDCNQEALKLIGFSREALIGSSPLKFSPPTQPKGVSSKAVLMEKTAIALQDVPQVFEWRLTKQGGADIDVEVSLNRFRIGDDPHGLAIIRDITERKKLMLALEERKQELNEKARYLEKVNQALRASLDHREIEKRSVEESILNNLRRFVYPYLEELDKCRLEPDAKAFVNILTTHLKDLTAQLSKTMTAKYLDFTPMEIRVADFIRDGKSSKQIAVLLGISPSSVQWHRKNIREKLGLTHKKINLNTFLASLTP